MVLSAAKTEAVAKLMKRKKLGDRLRRHCQPVNLSHIFPSHKSISHVLT